METTTMGFIRGYRGWGLGFGVRALGREIYT